MKLLIAIPIIIHGLAHIGGFLASFTKKDKGFKNKPWMFSKGVNFKSFLGKLYGLLWLASFIMFIYAGIIILLGKHWFEIPLLYGSILSLFTILSWWRSVPQGAKIGFIFNILILVSIHYEPTSSYLFDLIVK